MKEDRLSEGERVGLGEPTPLCFGDFVRGFGIRDWSIPE